MSILVVIKPHTHMVVNHMVPVRFPTKTILDTWKYVLFGSHTHIHERCTHTNTHTQIHTHTSTHARASCVEEVTIPTQLPNGPVAPMWFWLYDTTERRSRVYDFFRISFRVSMLCVMECSAKISVRKRLVRRPEWLVVPPLSISWLINNYNCFKFYLIIFYSMTMNGVRWSG